MHSDGRLQMAFTPVPFAPVHLELHLQQLDFITANYFVQSFVGQVLILGSGVSVSHILPLLLGEE
jgi:hypothetical protein